VAGGLVPVHQKASSACCGALLDAAPAPEGAPPAYLCKACGQPTERVLGPRTAHWTCACGQRRQQVVTEPQDEVA
jgi:hypothetical protein